MKTVEWKTYRTRFLVRAKQLSSGLSFTDHLGRQHCGRKGDYLVESSDGVLSIAPRQIFEDIYVPMSAGEDVTHETESAGSDLNPAGKNPVSLKRFRIEPLEIERVTADKFNPQVPAPRPPQGSATIPRHPCFVASDRNVRPLRPRHPGVSRFRYRKAGKPKTLNP